MLWQKRQAKKDKEVWEVDDDNDEKGEDGEKLCVAPWHFRKNLVALLTTAILKLGPAAGASGGHGDVFGPGWRGVQDC